MQANGQHPSEQRSLADPARSIEQAMEAMLYNASTMRGDLFRQFLDPRRNIDDECGYPTTSVISADSFKDLYDREAVACRVVQLMPKETWQNSPWVYESDDGKVDTKFEKAWDELGQQLRGEACWFQDEAGSPIWAELRKGDILSGIGYFGVILLGINDGKRLDQPVDGVVSYESQLIDYPSGKEPGNQAGPGPRTQNVMVVNERKRSREPITVNVVNRLTLKKEKRVVGWRVRNHGTTRRVYPTTPAAWPPGADGIETDKVRISEPEMKDGGDGNTRKPTGWRVDNYRALGKGDEPIPGVTTNDYPLRQPDGSLGFAQNPSGTDAQYVGVQLGPSEYPSAQASKEQRTLLYLRSFDESLVQIVQYEANVNNPRFGHPVMYRITLNDPREQHSGIGLPMATVRVHWSRIIHLADNNQSVGSSPVFGVPRQRPVLNRLLDLKKLYGGGAEGYWKMCFTNMVLSTHPQLGGDVNIDIAGLRNQVENMQNGLQKWLALTGMTAQGIAPQVIDSSPFIEQAIQAICIQIGCPKRVFMGSERGELASSQDDAAWNDRLRERQNSYNTPCVIVPFIDRLISADILPEPEGYSVEWPDLDSQTDKEKADVALAKTNALSKFLMGSGENGMTLLDFYVKVWGLEEEEAQQIVDNLKKEQDTTDDFIPSRYLSQGVQAMIAMFKEFQAGSLNQSTLKQLLVLFFKLDDAEADELIAGGLPSVPGAAEGTAVEEGALPLDAEAQSPATQAQPAPVVQEGIKQLLQSVADGKMTEEQARIVLVTYYDMGDDDADVMLAELPEPTPEPDPNALGPDGKPVQAASANPFGGGK